MPNVRAHCGAKPDSNQRINFLRRPDKTQRKEKIPSGS